MKTDVAYKFGSTQRINQAKVCQHVSLTIVLKTDVQTTNSIQFFLYIYHNLSKVNAFLK